MEDQTQTTPAEATVEVVAPVTVAKSKTSATGNLIHDIAVEIEGLTKTKALNQAAKLAEDIEANYFKLGGLLKLIQAEQWFDGFATFDAYVAERFGFAVRKAHYLIQIYTNLVDKQIPWEKVASLGWTKLKDLAPVLTLENLDDWVEKASKCTVVELQALIKASQNAGGGDSTSTKTTSDSVTVKFKLHVDQNEAVQTALAKAKGELTTEFDNVALSAICTGYLSNASGAVPAGSQVNVKEMFLSMGFEAVLGAFEQAFPLIELEVDVSKHMEAQG